MIIYSIIHLLSAILAVYLMGQEFKKITLGMVFMCILSGPIGLFLHIILTENIILWRKK